MIRSAALFAALQIVLGFGFIGNLGLLKHVNNPVEHAGWQCWVEDHRLRPLESLEVLDFDDHFNVIRFCNSAHVFVWFVVLVCLLAREKCLIPGKSQNNFQKLFE